MLQDEVHDPRSVAAALSRDPFVEYAEPDFVRLPMGDIGGVRPGRSALPEFPNDPLYTDAPYVDRFQLPEAWDVVKGEDGDVVIATPDRGTDGRHQDPINIHWTNPGEILGNGIDDEGNGFVDDVHGWNFSNYTPDATANPPDGFEAHHGTGIAGAAAAEVNNGSDDGLVYVIRDGGGKWQEVTPEGMPEWMMINDIVAHPFEPGGAYMAGTRYKLDDFQPYLYRTVDFGLNWTKIMDGIDGLHFARAIQPDPVRRGLLWAGTESGMYVSFDEGTRWTPFERNLPVVPVTDLDRKEDDLSRATQGRAFWVMDDVTPLRQLSDSVAASALSGSSVRRRRYTWGPQA